MKKRMKKIVVVAAMAVACGFGVCRAAGGYDRAEKYSLEPVPVDGHQLLDGSFSQTFSGSNLVSKVTTNVVQETAVDGFLNTVLGGALTNMSVDLYATYAPKVPNNNGKFGGGLFVAYNFNQFAGAGLGLDYLGQFGLVSGNVQFQAPFHLATVVPLFKNVSWYQNIIIAPFTIAGVGTPYSGNGQFNGSAMVISDVGGYVAFGHAWNGQFNAGVAWGKWVGQGPYGNVTRYHAFFGYMKQF